MVRANSAVRLSRELGIDEVSVEADADTRNGKMVRVCFYSFRIENIYFRRWRSLSFWSSRAIISYSLLQSLRAYLLVLDYTRCLDFYIPFWSTQC